VEQITLRIMRDGKIFSHAYWILSSMNSWVVFVGGFTLINRFWNWRLCCD
jgi:hypothetical protein